MIKKNKNYCLNKNIDEQNTKNKSSNQITKCNVYCSSIKVSFPNLKREHNTNTGKTVHLQTKTKTQYVTQIEIDDRAQNNRAPLTINRKAYYLKNPRKSFSQQFRL